MKSMSWLLVLVLCPIGLVAAEIRVREHGKCTGEWIRLKEVARLHADENEMLVLNEIYLGKAPSDGEPKVITREYIQHRLEQFGFLDKPHTVYIPESGVKVVRTDRLNRIDEVAMECEIQLLTHYEKVSRVDVTLEDPYERLGNLPKGLLSVSLLNKKFLPTASANEVPLTLMIRAGDTELNVTLKASVRLYHMQVVSTRKLGTRRSVLEDQVELKECEILPKEMPGFTSLEQVVGHRMSKYVPPGRRLVKGDILPPLLVKKGERVKLTSVSKSLKVTHYAKALDDAREGDVILFMSPNGTPVRGEVIAMGEARMLGRGSETSDRHQVITIGENK